MADEFIEHEHDATPSAADIEDFYGSQYLGASDIGTKKIRTKIVKVRPAEVKDRDTGRMKKKVIVWFESIDKGLILNKTNLFALNDALGKEPKGWLGATVGIKVDPNVTFGGKRTGGVRLHVLLPPAMTATPAAPAAKPAPAAAAADWPAEAGDPGFAPGNFESAQ
jgi:hypothetical protein